MQTAARAAAPNNFESPATKIVHGDMTLDVKPGSTSHRHWKLNWWDLWPLVDGEQRPVQWTSNSLILSPHPSSPAILARSYPSSNPFMLPSPNPVLSNPVAFSPPSIIEVAPGDEYAFAFFDGKGGDSVACIWHREETIDAWKVNIFWQIKPGQGIVLAKWLGDERMWLHTSPPVRAPPLGPSNPFGKISLLLVNQSHTVQVVHRPSSSFSFQLISASLRHASQANVGDRPAMGESTNGVGGFTVCVKAAIGLGYNESSLIIATSSTLIPPMSASPTEFPDSFGVSGTSTPPTTTPSHAPWENYGPEQIVRLCEVKLTAYGYILGVSTTPLPPLFPPTTSSSRLASILILPFLPNAEGPLSPEGSVVDKGSQSGKEESSTLLHIVLAYLDFEDYSSPKSELMSFELKRNKGMPKDSSKLIAWSHRHLTTRTITTSAISFILPSRAQGTGSILAGLLDLEGVAPKPSNSKDKGKSKEVGMGKVVMLKLPQLEDDENWEPSRLMTGADDVGADPPVSAAVSPAGSLICTSPAAWSGVSKLGVHIHPRQQNPPDTLSVPRVAELLLSTLLSDLPPADVLHALINPTFPLSSVTEVLERTLQTLDSDEFGSRDWHGIITGIALEIFRARSKRLSEDNPSEAKEKVVLDERWHVALDLCSVRALERAFEACKDEDEYDLEPIWQLIGLASWLVNFTERLVRTCVLWEGNLTGHSAKFSGGTPTDKDDMIKVKMEAMEVDGDDLFDGELSPGPDTFIRSGNSQLLHILHPYGLDNLIGALSHLNAFRAYLDTLQASAMKASIAKDVIVDVIDCSGIDFKELESALRQVKKELATVDADVLRRCLCSLSTLPSTHDVLVKACKLVTSPNAVSKPRLFIKPSDLVDGISRLSLAASKVSQERDVVSKGVLGAPGAARTCTRCKGKTETGQTPLPRGKETSIFGRWAVWEREWERCICGGLWIKERTR